jgi:hypothetical protein
MRGPQRIAPEDIRGDELRRWHVVECECWQCGHIRVVPHGLLSEGGRGRRRLSDLHFRCQWCGANGPHRLTVYALPRNI